MSEDNNVQEVARNNRGELGASTPGDRVKKLWKKTEFVDHPKRGRVSKSGVSLRAFAKQQSKDGNADAKDWLKNKHGDNNQKRSANNEKLAKEIAAATKQTRRKKSANGK